MTSSADTKPEVLLEGWQLTMLHDRPFYLTGFATGHADLPGTRRRVRTSLVLDMDAAAGRAETVNTVYRLRHPIRDMTFHPNGTVGRILLGNLTADRIEGGLEWLVLRDRHAVTTIASADPLHVILRLLSLVAGSE